MKKVLFVATVDYHFVCFHIPYLKWFKEQGYEVHLAARGELEVPYVDAKYNLPFERSPLSKQNYAVYKDLKAIILENNFNLVHAHTPVGGLLARLAARHTRKKGTKVLYTAHGFHFFTGAPLRNWLLFYPIEKWLSKYTDCLITINIEDYTRAKQVFPNVKVELVHGVGVDQTKFYPVSSEAKSALRNQYGFDEADCILIFVAELNQNKHQDLLIHAIKKITGLVPKLKLLLVGDGKLKQKYKELAKILEVDKNVHFLGYRKDIVQLLQLSDLAVSSSRREGLPVNVMEAMSVGLPVVATNVRGSIDLIEDRNNGFLVEIDDSEDFARAISEILKSADIKKTFGEKSLEIMKRFSLDMVSKEMEVIYKKYI